MKRVLLIATLLLIGRFADAVAWLPPPEPLTGGEGKLRLSRNPRGAIAVDGADNTHIVFWSGLESGTTPDTPSRVYYRLRTPDGAWSEPVEVDNSFIGLQRIGGRHPSLALTAAGGAWVVWHDHRHCAGPGWINNIEIYADYRPPGGTFSATDLRLTTTSAGHSGDNGYAPRIAVGPDGNAHVAWYDFHYVSGMDDTAELFLKSSSGGMFNLTESMAAMRQTYSAGRGGWPPYTLPDIAVGADGVRHLAWIGGLYSNVDLFYGYAPPAGGLTGIQTLAVEAAGYYDPPRLAVAPNGDVWVVYGDQSADDHEDIVALRRRAGEAAFDPPLRLAESDARETAPCPVFDGAGRLHLAYVEAALETHVVYLIYDPALNATVFSQRVTAQSRAWARPALALGAYDEPRLLVEEDIDGDNGALWFAIAAPEIPPSGVMSRRWRCYE